MSHKAEVVSADWVAQMTTKLIERWGPTPHCEDGEDSSGKQKFRLLTPTELALRALKISEETERVLFASGHLAVIGKPDPA